MRSVSSPTLWDGTAAVSPFKKKRAGDVGASSSFGIRKESALFRHRFVALGFQLRVLIRRKDGFGLFHERRPTLPGASVLHALLLPCGQFGILVCRQIQTGQVHATRAVIRSLHIFAATPFPAGKGRACRQ